MRKIEDVSLAYRGLVALERHAQQADNATRCNQA
jgi:hypothetical protein